MAEKTKLEKQKKTFNLSILSSYFSNFSIFMVMTSFRLIDNNI